MTKIYTIGFTKKDAKTFFTLLKDNGISVVVDVRLNNTSQLAGFTKYPDIKYFLAKCIKCHYISDKRFSPEEKTLKDYKSKLISWDDYVKQFNSTMDKRRIKEYISDKYKDIIKDETICFLCSEETAEYCHRRLIAEMFSEIYDLEIVHLV